jgi:4-hydroxymandelate synthase
MSALSTCPQPIAGLRLDHVVMYVGDLDREVAAWRDVYGFTVAGTAGSAGDGYRGVALRQERIQLVLVQATGDDHPAAAYVHSHGDGVADIVLRTDDVTAAFAHLMANGARPLVRPHRVDGRVTATVSGFGDVVHTLVERPADVPADLPLGFRSVTAPTEPGERPDLGTVDHLAICVPVGELAETVEYYRRALGFRQVFEERVVVGTQAMLSRVVQSRFGDVTFTVIQPDPDAEPGQIDEFLKNHGGAGVQHIAFSSPDAVRSVRVLGERGVGFLTTPDTYYELLGGRMALRRHRLTELNELGLLVDEDHGGQLYQIFTRTTHPRRTLFFEVIERLGAETFGSANIRALYEAVELARLRADGNR